MQKRTIVTKITKVYKSDKDKNQNPFKTKTQKPFWKVAIQTEATGDEWFSCIAFRDDSREMQIKEGSAYTLLVWEDNGFKNFKIPSSSDLLEQRIIDLEKAVFGSKNQLVNNTASTDSIEYPEEDINPEDIPF